MCFSPEASFLSAGLLSAIGAIAIKRTRERRELPMAAIPLLFGLQQAVEGALWLVLPVAPSGSAAHVLTAGFLTFALIIWPTYVPLAAISLEASARRRRLMTLALAAGVVTSAYFVWRMVSLPHLAVIRDMHIVYFSGRPQVAPIALAYLCAVAAPLLLSSRRMIVIFGAIVLVGAPVAYFFYLEAFQSVWCFFAAAASAVLLGHFERSRRRTPALPA
jgi:hypothetical protein